MTDQNQAQKEMPKYRCHKEVWALKIHGVQKLVGGTGVLFPVDTEFSPIAVFPGYMERHDPQPGGYYVVYKDGYESFSPAEAFESGYTKIDEIRAEAIGEAFFNDKG